MNASRLREQIKKAILVYRRGGASGAFDRIVIKLALTFGAPLFSARRIAKANQQAKRWQSALTNWNLDEKRSGVTDENVLGRVTCLIGLRKSQELVDFFELVQKQVTPTTDLLLKVAEAQKRLGNLDPAQGLYERAADLYPKISTAQRQMLLDHSQMHLLPERLELMRWAETNLDQIQELAKRNRSNFLASKPQKPNAFVFWAQGFENSPKIVQYCLKQMKRHIPEGRLQILTAENLSETIVLPKLFDRVSKLYPAHYSDVLRVALLSELGGTWLDATVLIDTDVLRPDGEYSPAPFFAFRYDGARVASWFMAADRDACTPNLLYAALQIYWRQHKALTSYFLLHDLLEVLYYLDPGVHAEWNSMKAVSSVPSQTLGRHALWQPFDAKELERILTERPVQKLTYKPAKRAHGKGTLYSHFTHAVT